MNSFTIVKYLSCFIIRVNEWVIVFNANSAIFQLYHDNFQWDDDEVHFVQDQHA
jgi:hypothetical protein